MPARMTAALVPAVVLAVAATGSTVAHALPADGSHHVAVASSSSYRYETFSVRRGGHRCTNAELNGISDHGSLAGVVFCGAGRGFVRVRGRLSVFRAPGRGRNLDTVASSVASDDTVSVFTEHSYAPPYHSFLRAPDGRFTQVRDPRAGRLGTQVLSVNASGTVVGLYFTGSAGHPHQHPFVRVDGRFRPLRLAVPHSHAATPTSVNDDGTVIGYYLDAKERFHGFVVNATGTRTVNAPHAGHERADGTLLSGVDRDGDYAGVTFSGQASHDFVHRHGHYHPIRVPTSFGSGTLCEGVNVGGVAVGFYVDTNDHYRAFIARPR